MTATISRRLVSLAGRCRRARCIDADRSSLHRRGPARRCTPRPQDAADQGRLDRAVHRRPAGRQLAISVAGSGEVKCGRLLFPVCSRKRKETPERDL